VGLDVQARETMWRTIRGLRDEGCAIVLTTHYLEEAEALADRVAVLAKGRLIAQGSVGEMRALVARKRISCASGLEVDDIKRWPGVVEAVREAHVVHVTASDADTIVRRLLAADPRLSQLEVKQASLAEAFTELTKEAA
jgi:ABC-type multidrug transport system ATPase subunit